MGLWMRKLKFAWILPPLQLFLAVSLLEWGSRVPAPKRFDSPWSPTVLLICNGINAPATPLKLLGVFFERVDHPPFTIFDVAVGDWFFAVGVIVVWHLVGRAVDRFTYADQWATARNTIWSVAFEGFLLGYGVFLFLLALAPLKGYNLNNPIGGIASGILFLVWSISLVVGSGIHLVRRFRLRHH
jgi:hypothetical protein